MRRPLEFSLIGIVVLASAFPALAAQRTFVASYGSDVAVCSLPAPCRGFAAAIPKTDPGGEIIVLDSAGYGAFTITQSVAIVAPPGIYAGVSVLAGDGIAINGAGIDVVLKGLTVNGRGGTIGIHYEGGASLTLERCTTTNFTANGIRLDAGGTIAITDTTVTDNGGDGISVSGPAAAVTITRARIDGNGSDGIRIQAAADVTLDRSVVTRNAGTGIDLFFAAVGTARLAIDASTVADNVGVGVYASANSPASVVHADVTRSTIARNSAGILAVASGGSISKVSATNNDVTDNAGGGIAANGAGSSIRAGGNKVMRNVTGLAQVGGGVVYTPMTNYVRDNSPDDGGHTADALL
jgi:parallel beta helix pectate lyase-like protein